MFYYVCKILKGGGRARWRNNREGEKEREVGGGDREWWEKGNRVTETEEEKIGAIQRPNKRRRRTEQQLSCLYSRESVRSLKESRCHRDYYRVCRHSSSLQVLNWDRSESANEQGSRVRGAESRATRKAEWRGKNGRWQKNRLIVVVLLPC